MVRTVLAVCCAMVPCLMAWAAPSVPQEGLERLAAVRTYKVSDDPAPKAQALPDPEPFFDIEADYPDDPQPSTEASRVQPNLQWGYVGLSRAVSGRAEKRRVQWQTRSLDTPMSTDWELGVSNWRYRNDDGFNLTLGGEQAYAPDWARNVRISGLSLSQTQQRDNGMQWAYAMSVGALDFTPEQEQGDLQYGPTAGSLMLSLSPKEHISLDSLLETSTELSVLGLGGSYNSGDLGVWQASVAKASHTYGNGWRYQASYGVDVVDNVHLQWKGEQYKSRFVDLSRYQSLASQRGGSRQAWELSAPVSPRAVLGTQYEVTRNYQGMEDRYVGVSQQFWYSSSLKLRLQARRHLDGQNSSIALRLSLPIF